MPRPKILGKDCNQHCSLEWRPSNSSSCSVDCGAGTKSVTYGCLRIMPNEPDLSLPEQYCDASEKPAAVVACDGNRCEGVKWRYGHWSECTLSCRDRLGQGGVAVRTAHCVDASGKRVLRDDACIAMLGGPETQKRCGQEECPKWMTGDWTEVKSLN